MASQTFGGDSIGPRLDLGDETIPPHIGAHLAALYDREDRVETWAEWVEVIRAASELTQGELLTEDDLCYVDDGNHTVEIDGETESFVCVLDPLAVPFIRGTPGTVRSKTPEDGDEITIDVESDGMTVDTDGAVISFGVSRDVDVDGTPTHEDIYAESCPYVHVFASVGEYERWADSLAAKPPGRKPVGPADWPADAATTSVSADMGVAIARELARELFES